MTRVAAEIRKEAIQEGFNLKAVEVAKNLLTLGIDIAIIVKSTGLSKEEVLEIKASIENN